MRNSCLASIWLRYSGLSLTNLLIKLQVQYKVALCAEKWSVGSKATLFNWGYIVAAEKLIKKSIIGSLFLSLRGGWLHF